MNSHRAFHTSPAVPIMAHSYYAVYKLCQMHLTHKAILTLIQAYFRLSLQHFYHIILIYIAFELNFFTHYVIINNHKIQPLKSKLRCLNLPSSSMIHSNIMLSSAL